jgi:hypothetical protein
LQGVLIKIDSNDSKGLITTSVLTGIITLGIVLIFYVNPVAYVRLIAEDSWGEYATFVFYALSFILMVASMALDRSKLKPGFVLITFCFFFMAMEEISWGQRIIGLDTPELLSDINRQGETNLHNLARVNKPLRFLAVIILFWAMGLPKLMEKYEKIKSLVIKLGTPMATKAMWPLFILPAVFIIAKPLIRGVEIGELLLGFAFFYYAVLFFKTTAQEKGVFSVSMGPILSVFCILAVLSTWFFVSNWPNPYALRLRYSDFVADEYPDHGLQKQSKIMLNYMLSNNQYMTIEFLEELDKHLAEHLKNKTVNTKQSDKNSLNEQIIHHFITENPVHFSASRKRKAFNLRQSDIDEKRAQTLYSIGTHYKALGDPQTAKTYFDQVPLYTNARRLIQDHR